MFLRIPITLAQVKVGYTSEKLQNETGQIIYSLDLVKEIPKDSIMISIRV